MRLLCVLVLTLVCACSSSVVPPRQGLVLRDLRLPLRQIVYPSGLRVVAERDARSPVVGLFLVVGAGSTSDPPGKEGMAHFVEHLTFRSRPFGKSSFARLLDRAGASQWNATTELDATTYFEIGPSAALTELLRLEGARMLAPIVKLTPETLEVERNVVRSELRQRNETGFVGEVLGSLQAAVFPEGHPYARPVIGTHATLESINADDVGAFLHAQYRPENMTLVIVGDVDLATVDRTLAQSLPPELLTAAAPVKPRPALPVRAPEPPAPPRSTTLPRKQASVATPEIWVGWSLPRAFDADAHLIRFVQSAAAGALAGAPREHDDIVGVGVMLVPGKEASMLLCRVITTLGLNPERSLEHVLDKLHTAWGMTEGSVGAQVHDIQFAAYKRRAAVGMLLEVENLSARGMKRAKITHFTGDPAMYTRALKNVGELESTRVGAYASRYLTRDRARAVVLTPTLGGALPEALPVGSDAFEDEGPPPVHVDAERLKAVFTAPRTREFHRVTLANGIQVILGRRAGVPAVSAGLLLYGGWSATGDVGGAYLADLLGRPNETGYGEPFQIGAGLSDEVRVDGETLGMNGSAGNVGTILAILAERVQSMEVDSGSWAPFERDALPYFRLAERKPEVVSERAYLSALLAGHPYGRSPTARDLAEQHRRGPAVD